MASGSRRPSKGCSTKAGEFFFVVLWFIGWLCVSMLLFFWIWLC